ncbi:MAG: hypothetical protein AB7R00_29530 [Kofleriaceae bacterium]
MRTMTMMTALLALASACATNDQGDTEDARDDDFLQDGKSDVGGVAEGSPVALAVLAVVNDSTREVFLEHVMISELATDSLLAARAGQDAVAGTDDDVRFATLAELDAVPYMGPGVFAKLVAYADPDGLLRDDPRFRLVTDKPRMPWMTYAELFDPSRSIVVSAGTATMIGRNQYCASDAMVCGAWEDSESLPTLMNGSNNYVQTPSLTVGLNYNFETRAGSLQFHRGDFSQAGSIYCKTGSTLDAADPDVPVMTCDTYIRWQGGYLTGYLYGDGTFHFVSPHPTPETIDPGQSFYQVAIFGQLAL